MKIKCLLMVVSFIVLLMSGCATRPYNRPIAEDSPAPTKRPSPYTMMVHNAGTRVVIIRSYRNELLARIEPNRSAFVSGEVNKCSDGYHMVLYAYLETFKTGEVPARTDAIYNTLPVVTYGLSDWGWGGYRYVEPINQPGEWIIDDTSFFRQEGLPSRGLRTPPPRQAVTTQSNGGIIAW